MLVVGRLHSKLRRVMKESRSKRLDLDKLKDPLIQRELSVLLQNRFKVMDSQEDETGVEHIWQSVKSIYT